MMSGGAAYVERRRTSNGIRTIAGTGASLRSPYCDKMPVGWASRARGRVSLKAAHALVLSFCIIQPFNASADSPPNGSAMKENPCPPAIEVAQRERAQGDWANLCRYRQANGALSSPTRVVFMGDSITENWVTADPGLFKQGVVGRGISGQTSPQMLLRFFQDVIDLHPQVVHIMAGTNDVA